jgi:hypothetical protein
MDKFLSDGWKISIFKDEHGLYTANADRKQGELGEQICSVGYSGLGALGALLAKMENNVTFEDRMNEACAQAEEEISVPRQDGYVPNK